MQDPVTNSRSAAWADYDRDGDADLFVSNSSQSNALYRNNQESGTWLQIRLEGLLPNSTVIGAQVIVKTKLANEDRSVLLQKRTIEAQSGLTGQNSPVLQFGMRQETMVDSIIIIWPDGLVETACCDPRGQSASTRR